MLALAHLLAALLGGGLDLGLPGSVAMGHDRQHQFLRLGRLRTLPVPVDLLTHRALVMGFHAFFGTGGGLLRLKYQLRAGNRLCLLAGQVSAALAVIPCIAAAQTGRRRELMMMGIIMIQLRHFQRRGIFHSFRACFIPKQLLAAIAQIMRFQALLGAGGRDRLLKLQVMAQRVNRVCFIRILAQSAGVGGIAAFGTGSIHRHGFINMGTAFGFCSPGGDRNTKR